MKHAVRSSDGEMRAARELLKSPHAGDHEHPIVISTTSLPILVAPI